MSGESRMKPASYRIEVSGKPAFADPAGAAVLAQIHALGLSCVTEVRVGPVYEVAAAWTLSEAAAAAQGLLADPITQEFRLNGNPPGVPAPAHWRIEVWLKPSVTDPTEGSVRKAVTDLGLPPPERVRCGTAYRLLGRLLQAQAERIAAGLLANPVIHQFIVTQA